MGKRHKPEEVIAKLRQVDVMTSQGTTVADAARDWGHRGHLTHAGARSTAA